MKSIYNIKSFLKINGVKKMKTITFFFLIVFSIVIFSSLNGQAETYYSAGNNEPNLVKNWWTNIDGTGSQPKDFKQGDTFIIQNGHTMTTTADWTVSGTGAKIQINSGGTLVANNKVTSTSMIVTGTYQHNKDKIQIPTATWEQNSLCLITGVIGTQLEGDNQNFWNLTYNCAGMTKDLNLDALSVGGDLEILNTGNKKLLQNETSLTVGGNCTIQDYFVIAKEQNSRTLTVNGNISVLSGGIMDFCTGGPASNSTGTLIIKGNLDVSAGSLLISGSGKNYGVINFNGTSLQNFITTGVRTTANDIISYTINNAAGVTISGNLLVVDNASLTLTNGNLNTASGSLLTLSNSATVSGGSATSFVKGPMAKMTNSTSSFTFPVGKGSTYMPLGIKPNSTAASTFRVEYNNYAFTNTTSFGTGIAIVSRIDHYDLSRTSGSANVYVTVYWNASSGVTTSDLSYLKVAHFNGSYWEDLGHGTVSGTASSGSITSSSAASSFSPFALGSSQVNGPLPVSLASLTSSVAGRNVNLKWMTSSETNNSGFDVERKGFTGNYEKVGHVQGKGTVSTPSSYEFTDRNLATGNYSYRLKQIDNNGNFEYFSLNGDVVVGVPSKFDLSQNYPNPFNPSTKINFDLPKDGLVSLKIYDMTGKEISTIVNEFRAAGYYTIDFNASSLSSGLYFYRISSGEFSSVKKMMLVK